MDSISHQLEIFKISNEESRQRYVNNIGENPLLKMKIDMHAYTESKKLERVHLLQRVHMFQNVSNEILETIACGLDEIKFKQNEWVLRQGERGDAFYILESGLVGVIINTNDSGISVEREVRVLAEGDYFGETALYTDDVRTASIVVKSQTATCLQMTKEIFHKIIRDMTKMFSKVNDKIVEKALASVPLLKDTTVDIRNKIAAVLTMVNFPSSSYIYRQGTIGNTFFILLSGKCVLTVSGADLGKETIVEELRVGDYFGETALTGRTNVRPTNVFTTEQCSVVVLKQSDFDAIMRAAREQALALMKTVPSFAKATPAMDWRRRVTAMDEGGSKSVHRSNTLIMRFGRFAVESLWNCLYHRMLRQMILLPQKATEYGDIALKIIEGKLVADDSTLQLLRRRLVKIMSTDPERRSLSDTALVGGLLKQRSDFKKLFGECNSEQMFELGKFFRVVRFQSLERIIECGEHNTTAFVVLRGSVRIFHPTSGTHSKKVIFDRDLMPGEMFCEKALEGVSTSWVRAVAILDCELGAITLEDYKLVMNIEGKHHMHTGDKMDFLRHVHLFKPFKYQEIAVLADLMEVAHFSKGRRLLEVNGVSDRLYFVVDGCVNFLSNWREGEILATAVKYEHFGESCLGKSSKPTKLKHKHTPGRKHEHHGDDGNEVNKHGEEEEEEEEDFSKEAYAIECATNVTLLTLAEKDFSVLLSSMIAAVVDGYKSKVKWRKSYEVTFNRARHHHAKLYERGPQPLPKFDPSTFRLGYCFRVDDIGASHSLSNETATSDRDRDQRRTMWRSATETSSDFASTTTEENTSTSTSTSTSICSSSSSSSSKEDLLSFSIAAASSTKAASHLFNQLNGHHHHHARDANMKHPPLRDTRPVPSLRGVFEMVKKDDNISTMPEIALPAGGTQSPKPRTPYSVPKGRLHSHHNHNHNHSSRHSNQDGRRSSPKRHQKDKEMVNGNKGARIFLTDADSTCASSLNTSKSDRYSTAAPPSSTSSITSFSSSSSSSSSSVVSLSTALLSSTSTPKLLPRVPRIYSSPSVAGSLHTHSSSLLSLTSSSSVSVSTSSPPMAESAVAAAALAAKLGSWGRKKKQQDSQSGKCRHGFGMSSALVRAPLPPVELDRGDFMSPVGVRPHTCMPLGRPPAWGEEFDHPPNHNGVVSAHTYSFDFRLGEDD